MATFATRGRTSASHLNTVRNRPDNARKNQNKEENASKENSRKNDWKRRKKPIEIPTATGFAEKESARQCWWKGAGRYPSRNSLYAVATERLSRNDCKIQTSMLVVGCGVVGSIFIYLRHKKIKSRIVSTFQMPPSIEPTIEMVTPVDTSSSYVYATTISANTVNAITSVRKGNSC